MLNQDVAMIDRYAEVSLSFLQRLLRDYHPRDFAVRLWDGTTWHPEPGQPARFTLVIRHPSALRRMFWIASTLTLGEAFIYDDFDVEGDLEGVFPVAEYLANRRWGPADLLRYASDLFKLPQDGGAVAARSDARLKGAPHSKKRDRQAVTYHYDVSNDFYTQWLDKRMVYSCAYFAEAGDDLDEAQARKLDYICRKLRLKPGEHLLDIGCGWGGLVMHAAQRYGVHAVGITLSSPQAELANARIRDAGLADRCRVEVRDYRDIDRSESYDKLVSVGMFEHVGAARLPDYFERAWRLLRPGGVFLNHGIACGDKEMTKRSRRPSFSDRYVFPDGELVPISTTLDIAENSGFELRDVESLREHYALTLRQWVRRLETRRSEACRATDPVTYRVWRLFMSASAYGFKTGLLNVYQTLLVKPDQGASGLPLTRADWYP